MIMKVIGVELRQGNFTDKKTGKDVDYNNVMIYALKPNTYSNSKNNSFGSGQIPVEIKIKNEVDILISIFGTAITEDDLVSMVGKEYNISFDDKKNVDCIMSVPAPAASKKGA